MYIDNDFWDIASLTPPKKRISYGKNSDNRKRDTETALIDIDTTGSSVQNTKETVKKPIVIDKSQAEKESNKTGNTKSESLPYEYLPDNKFNKFIFSVKVAIWPSQYTFYEKFEQDALQFVDKNLGECEYVPFFSFMPQYSQMTSEQIKYYFWWRANLKEGKFLKTDFCYIQLFIYEIINLPYKITPENGVNYLCDIWANYRDKFPKLDKYLSEWVCDYCLINNVELPIDKIVHFLDDIIKNASFKEFYLSLSKDDNAYAVAVMELSSGYNYRKSKYVNEQNRKLFYTHIQGAILAFAEKMASTDTRFNLCKIEIEPVTLSRDTYVGAICSYRVKRRLTIKYVPVTRNSELHYYITDAIKLAENYVRAFLGIKSRFSTPHLTKGMRVVISEYFEENLPSSFSRSTYEKTKTELEVQTYERFYDGEKESIDFESALEIENKSREIIEKLAVELEVENETEEPITQTFETQDKENDIILLALSKIVSGDNIGLLALAKKENILIDTLIEKINEAAIDKIGDIAVEYDGSSYNIISDYMEDILEWIKT